MPEAHPRPYSPSALFRAHRTTAVCLGVVIVVGTAGVARASGNADGFLAPAPTPTPSGTTAMAGAAPTMTAAAPSGTTTAPMPAAAPSMSPSAGAPSMAAAGTGVAAQDAAMCRADAMRQSARRADMSTQDGMSTRSERMSRRLHFRMVGDARTPEFNQALGINNVGVVVGYSGSGADAQHPNRAFEIRPPYRQRDLRPRNVSGSVQTQDIGINRARDQVGFFVDKGGVTQGFVRIAGVDRPVTNPLGSAHPAVDQLLGINDRRVAAGFYNDTSGASHPYVYNVCDRTFRPVALPFAVDSAQATGVNRDGVVTGLYTVGKVTRGFVAGRRTVTTIKLGNDTNTQALGIDSAGDVVGSFVDRRGHTRGYIWSHGRARAVDAPGADGTTVVNGINDVGQVVGFTVTSAHRTIGFVAR